MCAGTAEHVVVDLTVNVTNPSPVSIQPIGDLIFSIFFKDSYMGDLYATNATMLSGITQMTMTGFLEPTNQTILNELMSRYLQGVPTNVTAKAKSVSTQLFNSSLSGLELTTLLSSVTTQIVKGLTIDGLSVQPVDDTTAAVTAKVTVEVQNPMGARSPLVIHGVQMDGVSLSNRGELVGSLDGPVVTPTSDGTVHEYANITFESACVLRFGENYPSGMVDFVSSFIQYGHVDIVMDGLARTIASSAIGNIDVFAPVVNLTSSVQALNNLTGACTIVSWSVSGDDHSTVITTVARIHNPAPVTMSIGDLTLDATALGGSLRLGALTGKGVTLAASGDTTITFTGPVKLDGPDQLALAGQFFSTFLDGKTQTLAVSGKASTFNGKSIRWLSESVKVMQMHTAFPGFSDPSKLMTNLQMVTMGMRLTGPQGQGVDLSGHITLTVNLPTELKLPVHITAIGMNVEMQTMDGHSILTLSIPASAAKVQHDPATGHLDVQFGFTSATVKSVDAFSAFVSQAMRQDVVDFVLVGTGDVTASTQLGALSLAQIPFRLSTSTKGMQGLKDVKVTAIDIIGGTPDTLQLTTSFDVTSPSNVAASLGQLSFELHTDNGGKAGPESLAVVTVANFTLGASGTTSFQATAVFRLPVSNPAAGIDFLSRYASRQDVKVVMVGTMSSSASPLLKPALTGFTMSTIIPGRSAQLLLAGQLKVPLWNPVKVLQDLAYLPTVMKVANPFGASVKIVNAKEVIFWEHDGKIHTMGMYNKALSGLFPHPPTLSGTRS